MHWILVSLLVLGCAADPECEPFIEYSHMPTNGPGCRNLSFQGMPVPAKTYPVDSRALVNECQEYGRERLFECEPDGHWRELLVALPEK